MQMASSASHLNRVRLPKAVPCFGRWTEELGNPTSHRHNHHNQRQSIDNQTYHNLSFEFIVAFSEIAINWRALKSARP